MDRLDRISIWAIVVLIIISSALISHHMGEARTERKDNQRVPVSAQVVNPEVVSSTKVIRDLMERPSLIKAEGLAKEMIGKYPYEGEVRMLMGDIYFRKQEIIKAVEEYKTAVDLNPDYLDKKTVLFQGKKLKRVVSEALSEVEGKLKINPQDGQLKKFRKDIYYLQRRIAGSCG